MRDEYWRAETLIEAAQNSAKTREGKDRAGSVGLYSSYTEPRYTDPISGVIALGNWNKITKWDEDAGHSVHLDDIMSRLGEALETWCGAELEWEDEWACCEDCGKLFRISPDSYSWQQYGVTENCCICGDCIAENARDYLENLEDNDHNCATIQGIDPAEYEYTPILTDLEHGFHLGQDADPKVIAESLRDMGIERFLFVLDSAGQFDLSFSTWIHDSEMDKFNKDGVETNGPSVSAALERGLKVAALQSSKLPDVPNHVKYTKITGGKAEARLVGPQEFIDGIKD